MLMGVIHQHLNCNRFFLDKQTKATMSPQRMKFDIYPLRKFDLSGFSDLKVQNFGGLV